MHKITQKSKIVSIQNEATKPKHSFLPSGSPNRTGKIEKLLLSVMYIVLWNVQFNTYRWFGSPPYPHPPTHTHTQKHISSQCSLIHCGLYCIMTGCFWLVGWFGWYCLLEQVWCGYSVFRSSETTHTLNGWHYRTLATSPTHHSELELYHMFT